MKRILVALLALLTVLSCFALPVAADEPVVADEVKDEVKDNPSSFTLVGTPDLPPICNQGEVGCCASCAITYTQYTNAVSKYIRKYHPEMTFEPATGEQKYLFAPKWTYGFSGAGTAWVYDILMDHGAVTMDVSSFYLHPLNGSFLLHKLNGRKDFMASAVAWDITKNQMENAMRFRLNGYEQIWVGGNHDLGKVGDKLQLTTTKEGQELLNKIKSALNAGNVVVTGGLSSVWQFSTNKDQETGKLFGKMVDNGTLGKKTDAALIYSRGKMAGGHQLSIVGYDDDIAFEVNGVTLKGAFQVSNSWGTTWMNEGYVWLMYDALNELSEFEELNFEDRTISMDQFCFTDWETNVVDTMPELYVEAEVSALNRESINIFPTVMNKESKVVTSYTPRMFYYANYHPKYEEVKGTDYLNINGEINGEEAKGVFAFDYDDLTLDEASFKNNAFGVRVAPKSNYVTVHALRLKNNRGDVLAEITLPEGGKKLTTSETFYFEGDLCKIVFNQDHAVEGSSFEAFDAYYMAGNKVPLNITVEEGYTDVNAKVVTADGATIAKNDQGVFELTVSADTTISYSGIEKEAPVEPSEPSEPAEPSKESNAPVESEESVPEDQDQKDQGASIGLIVGIVIGAVVLLAAVVVVIIVLVKKNKK